jgi:hypothetical protein
MRSARGRIAQAELRTVMAEGEQFEPLYSCALKLATNQTVMNSFFLASEAIAPRGLEVSVVAVLRNAVTRNRDRVHRQNGDVVIKSS